MLSPFPNKIFSFLTEFPSLPPLVVLTSLLLKGCEPCHSEESLFGLPTDNGQFFCTVRSWSEMLPLTAVHMNPPGSKMETKSMLSKHISGLTFRVNTTHHIFFAKRSEKWLVMVKYKLLSLKLSRDYFWSLSNFCFNFTLHYVKVYETYVDDF